MTLAENIVDEIPQGAQPAGRGSAQYAIPSAVLLGGSLLAASAILFQLRRPVMAVWPVLDVLAAIVAGSALTHWLAPRVASAWRKQCAHSTQESNTISPELTGCTLPAGVRCMLERRSHADRLVGHRGPANRDSAVRRR
jgi:hypothetical protein